MRIKDGESIALKSVRLKLSSEASGLTAIIAGSGFTEHQKISKDQKAKSFFVLLAVIVLGKMRIGVVEKMRLIG